MSKFHVSLLGSLPAFEAAARHRSIKKASSELHVTHAAVSRHIRKLERVLGHRLFKRGHRSMVPTDAGEFLLGAVSTGLSHIQRAFDRLSGSAYPDTLVISVDPDFAGLWLVPRLGGFYANVPNTLVEILAEKTAPSLDDPRASCAIQYAEAGLTMRNVEMLFRSRLSPVCGRGLAPLLNSPLDLRCHTLLHDRSTLEWEQYLLSSSVSIDMDVRSGIVFSDTAHCLDAAARGQGVAIGDDCLAAMHLAEGRLLRPFGSAVLSKNAYYLVRPGSSSQHPSLDAFRVWLLRSIECERADLGAA